MELTRTEIESQIKNIDLILKLYDQLIVFFKEYENESFHIYNAKGLMEETFGISTLLGTLDFEEILQKIKSELEII